MVAVCALVVSICALVISVQEIRIMRKQQKASMYPYLTAGKSYNAEGFGVQLKNSGNGLARIDSYQIYNDSIYFSDWIEVVETLMPEAKNIHYNIIRTSGGIRNQMIPPGEEVNLIFFTWTEETRKLQKEFQDLKLKICYSSLLDEHWTLTGNTPEPLDGKCIPEMDKEFGR